MSLKSMRSRSLVTRVRSPFRMWHNCDVTTSRIAGNEWRKSVERKEIFMEKVAKQAMTHRRCVQTFRRYQLQALDALQVVMANNDNEITVFLLPRSFQTFHFTESFNFHSVIVIQTEQYATTVEHVDVYQRLETPSRNCSTTNYFYCLPRTMQCRILNPT